MILSGGGQTTMRPDRWQKKKSRLYQLRSKHKLQRGKQDSSLNEAYNSTQWQQNSISDNGEDSENENLPAPSIVEEKYDISSLEDIDVFKAKHNHGNQEISEGIIFDSDGLISEWIQIPAIFCSNLVSPSSFSCSNSQNLPQWFIKEIAELPNCTASVSSFKKACGSLSRSKLGNFFAASAPKVLQSGSAAQAVSNISVETGKIDLEGHLDKLLHL